MSTVKGSSRNDHCPRCKKKFKDCGCKAEIRGLKRRSILMLFIGITLIASALYLINYSNAEAAHKRHNRKQQFYTAVTAYLNRPADKWWFSGREHPLRLAEKLSKMETVIGQLLAENAGDHPLAAKIATRYRKIAVSVYERGYTRRVTTDRVDLTEKPDIEVAFVPYLYRGRPEHLGMLYYCPSMHAVVVFGLDWPEPVFASLLEHELAHALLSDQGKSISATPGSAEAAREEVQTHQLEAAVLNRYTSGQIQKEADRIIRTSHYPDPVDTAMTLSLADLQKFDQMLGAKGMGMAASANIASQYTLMVAFRAIDLSTATEGNKRAQKERAYVRLFQILSNGELVK